VLLVNLLAALNFANVFLDKNVWKIKNVKKRKNVFTSMINSVPAGVQVSGGND